MEPTSNYFSVPAMLIPTNRDRCRMAMAFICTFISVVGVIGCLITIEWLSEQELQYPFFVVLFMSVSGVLYFMGFIGSLFYMDKLINKENAISRVEPNLYQTDCVQNHRNYETDLDILHHGGTCPHMVNAVVTPPPPYEVPSGRFTSRNDTSRVQSTQDSNGGVLLLNRNLCDCNIDCTQESEYIQHPFNQEHAASHVLLTSHNNTGSLNSSNPVTYALRKEMASNSPLELKQRRPSREASQEPDENSGHRESAISENCPRLQQQVNRPSRIISNSEVLILQSNSCPQRIFRFNSEVRVSPSRSNPQCTQRMPINFATKSTYDRKEITKKDDELQ